MIESRRGDHPNQGVAQKLEPLIVLTLGATMGQRSEQQALIQKLIPESLLECVECWPNWELQVRRLDTVSPTRPSNMMTPSTIQKQGETLFRASVDNNQSSLLLELNLIDARVMELIRS